MVNGMERMSFDGRYLLNRFRNYEFGKLTLNEIHLSKRAEYDEKTNYYKAFHVIKLHR